MVEEAAIGIAADEVDVHRLEIGGRIAAPRRARCRRSRRCAQRGSPRCDRHRPRAGPPSTCRRRRAAISPAASPLMWRGASGSCSQRIALPSGQRDGSKRVRLADADGRRLRQHAALGLVARPSTRRRGRASDAAAPPCRAPASRHAAAAFERIVDLHVALAVAIALRRRRDIGCGTCQAFEQAAIELGRRHRADDALGRRDRLARGQRARRWRGRASSTIDWRHRHRCGSRRPGRGSAPRRRRAGSAHRP